MTTLEIFLAALAVLLAVPAAIVVVVAVLFVCGALVVGSLAIINALESSDRAVTIFIGAVLALVLITMATLAHFGGAFR